MGVFNWFKGEESSGNWQDHVNKVKAEHPDWPLKKVLKEAKKNYRRKK